MPLGTHTMRAYATESWSDVSLSVYAATQGNEEWIRVDNASLRETPSAAIGGTECSEPGEEPPPPVAAAASSAPAPRASVAGGVIGRRGAGASQASTESRREARQASGSGRAPTVAPGGSVPVAGLLRYVLAPSSRPVALQISRGHDEWETVAVADPSEDWRVVTIDTTEVADGVLYLRVIG
jgi:hypothetical protein